MEGVEGIEISVVGGGDDFFDAVVSWDKGGIHTIHY